jgi:hypothetical protein
MERKEERESMERKEEREGEEELLTGGKRRKGQTLSLLYNPNFTVFFILVNKINKYIKLVISLLIFA